MSIFYRFRDIVGYLSKVADFVPPYLHLGGGPIEFRGHLWRPKTRVPGLSRSLRLAVLVELRLVTDTDRQTQTQAHAWAYNTAAAAAAAAAAAMALR